LLKNVRIVDVQNEAISLPTRVLIRDSRIAAIGPKLSGGNVRMIEGAGGFLIPGLWDMHVHVGAIEEDWFPLYLANGITGLREMAASAKDAEQQKRYVADVEKGARLGPKLVWTLGAIDRDLAPTPEKAREAVRSIKAAGASFVKVYNGLSRDAYLAIASESFRQLMPFTGHVPDAVRWSEAVRTGQRSIEHLDGMLLACCRRESEARQMLLTNQDSSSLIVSSFDASRLAALAKAASSAQCWHTPTMTVLRYWATPRAFLSDPRLQYVRRDYLKGWKVDAHRATESNIGHALYAKHKEAVRALHQAGAPILAGTDTPNASCIPGFALHDELALLVEAGLSPGAALRAATLEPARYFGSEKETGTVAVGKVADLVLLEANPLVNIRNTTRISAVIRGGIWLDRTALDSMLEKVRSAVAPAP
jgi:hypothetical protein